MYVKNLDNNLDKNSDKNVVQKKFSGLDAIRTLAIGGVTFFHMFPDTIKGGYLGVSLFFVLTGFLLAYTTSAQASFNVLSYYWKRFKRIYPELLVMLLVTVGTYYFLLPKAVAGVFGELTSVLLGYNNWWQILQNADYFARVTNSSPFTHLWFLGIEIQYYFIWPLLYIVYKELKKCLGTKVGVGFLGVFAVASAALMPIMYNPELDVTRLYYGTDTRIYALLLGAIIGLDAGESEKSNVFKLKFAGKILFGGVLAITLIAYVLMGGQSSLTYQGGMLAMTILFCLMLCLLTATNLGEELEHPICTFFGKYSYGIFLWQYPVIYLFGHMPWGNIPGSALLQLIVICALAVWSKHFSDVVMAKKMPAFTGGRKLAFGLLALVTIGLMGVGTKAFVSSYGYKNVLKAELEAQLKANAEKLAAENAAAEKAAHEQAVNVAKGQVDLRGVVCIGDSVMLGASSALRKELPGCYIDAAVSRYINGGVQVAEQLAASGKLGKIVLIHLGTNGPIAGYDMYEKHTKRLLEILGPDREIFWVNFYCPETTWQDTNNAYLSNTICGYHSNVHLINWYELVHDKPQLLVGDRIHPSSEGIKRYGELVKETMVKVLAEQSVKKAKKNASNNNANNNKK